MLRTFPRGLPGLALFVLRASLAMMAVRLGLTSGLISPFGLAAAILAVAALLLFAGVATRLVACFSGAAAFVSLLLGPNGYFESAMLVSAISFCVTILGPGSYSVDSLWFGVPKRIFPLDQ